MAAVDGNESDDSLLGHDEAEAAADPPLSDDCSGRWQLAARLAFGLVAVLVVALLSAGVAWSLLSGESVTALLPGDGVSGGHVSELNMSGALVMGAATGYHWQQLYAFLRSFRLHCRDCQLVVFVDRSQLTAEDLQLYRLSHAQLIDAKQLLSLYPLGSLHHYEEQRSIGIDRSRIQLYYDYLRALPQFSRLANRQNFTSFSSRPEHNPITQEMVAAAQREAYETGPGQFRLEGYSGEQLVVPDLSTPISHVLLTDMRDAVWQGNVFSWLPYRHQFEGDDLRWAPEHQPSPYEQRAQRPLTSTAATYSGLFVFTEEVMSGSNRFNNIWTDCVDPEYRKRHTSKPVLCSGTALASYDSALHYLRAMQQFMLRDHVRCTLQLGGMDQGAHQMLVYDGGIDTAVVVVPSARSPVATVGVPLVRHPETLRFSPYGDLINDWNETYALIHQYDRGPHWEARVRLQYPTTPIKLNPGVPYPPNWA